MGRRPHESRRVRTLEADYLVSDHGKVKLADNPLNLRLRYVDVCGHKAFTLSGTVRFIADLMARAFLNSEHGFIDYKDGDPKNLRPHNIVIAEDDAVDPRIDAMMRRPREAPPTRHESHFNDW